MCLAYLEISCSRVKAVLRRGIIMGNVPSVREPIHTVHLSQRLPVRFFYQSHGHRGLEDCTRRDEDERMKQGVIATRTASIDAPCGMMRRAPQRRTAYGCILEFVDKKRTKTHSSMNTYDSNSSIMFTTMTTVKCKSIPNRSRFPT